MNLKNFIGKNQLACMRDCCKGEEGPYFIEMIGNLKKMIAAMPKTYETEDLSDTEKMVTLHYFKGGADWYIIERDAGSPDDNVQGVQAQAYGFSCLNGDRINAEFGYICIDELIRFGVELDLYYTPESVKDLKERYGKTSADDVTSDDLINQYMSEGVCPALDGCTVELDGHCPHGSPSVVLSAGLI